MLSLHRRLFTFILIIVLAVSIFMTALSYLLWQHFSGWATSYWFVLLLNLFVPLLVLAIVIFFIERRFATTLHELERNVQEINRVEDLTQVYFERIDFGFEDLNQIRDEIVELVEKLRRVAVDKDVLEFELRLLEHFIITPHVLRNWKDTLRDIFKKLQEFFEIVYFFVVFKEEKGTRVYLFEDPSLGKEEIRRVEENVRRILEGGNFLEETRGPVFVHEPLFENQRAGFRLDTEEISHLSKFAKLETPPIGGGVGIGLRAQGLKSEAKILTLESFLSAILNLLISVKAVESYTRDLEYYATRDPLTGLYNRRMFRELLAAELERAKRHHYKFALVFLDLDNFKLINDTYGHEFGDQFLNRLADILRDTFRKEDVVARYGGDEFVALLPYADGNQARRVAQRLLNNLWEVSFDTPDGRFLKASCSVGIAVYPDHAVEAEDLLFLADRMMYRAKVSGKNRIALPERRDLGHLIKEKDAGHFLLLEALEKRRVTPFFQPILNLWSGKVESFEVLMRLEKEDGSLLSAYEFISLAERSGLIDQLESILLEKTLQRVAGLKTNFCLFFNLSPRTLIRSEFRKWLLELLKSYCFSPERIVVELTERETVRELEVLCDAVQKLRSEGLRFALDDFGSGFASYQYLKHLPMDYIKIEGEFVRAMRQHDIDQAFVVSAVTMADLLGIKTIAEFVEEASLLDKLKEIGVGYAQGYYIGRPSPDLEAALEKFGK